MTTLQRTIDQITIALIITFIIGVIMGVILGITVTKERHEQLSTVSEKTEQGQSTR